MTNDSKHINELLADTQAALERGEIPCAIFADSKLYVWELESIFAKCWVFVAHESEIPTAGDYVLRTIGEDEVIVVRDSNTQVRVLRNACRHRGARVCHSQRGNANQFYCPNHGWTYSRSGEWIGAPFKDRAYKKLDSKRWGLLAAPHVDSYRGLIFASLDPNAIPLAEHLGDMRWYLDICFGLQHSGMKVSGRPNRWLINSNWKTAAENFLADGYHLVSLHRSIEEIGVMPKTRNLADSQFQVYFNNGHGALLSHRPLPDPWGILGYPPVVTKTFDLDELSESQLEFLNTYAVTTFTIFPNLSFIRVPGRPDQESPPTLHTELRQWQPRGPDQIEVWNWCMVWPGAPDWFNQQSYRAGITSFGPAGIYEQDDTAVWSGASSVGGSVFGGRHGATFNYELGAQGMSDYTERSDWLGPGTVSNSAFGEQAQRAFYAHWLNALHPRGDHSELSNDNNRC